MKTNVYSLLVVLVLASCMQGAAATLATYNFTAVTPPLDPTSFDSNITASAISGTGNGRSNGAYVFQNTTTANSGYMQFTLTANTGLALDLSSISFSYDFLQSLGTNTAVNSTFALVYSTNSFATSTSLYSIVDASQTPANATAPTFTTTGAIDLSGIPDLTTLDFRILLSNGSSLNTTNYRYTVDNIVILGNTVAVVPEPSTYVLLTGGMMLMFLLRLRFCRDKP